MLKRLFDCVTATCGLLAVSPLLAVVAVLVKRDSPGPVLFKQRRIGKDFRPFTIYKFRTMVPDAPRRGGAITCGEDPRITRIGRFLRRTKLDELPQLFNVLKGDMSFVGPRPEVEKYVDLFRDDYRVILRTRPGITDLASIEFRDEAAILGQAARPEEEYVHRILPEKIRLSKKYLERSSLGFDLVLIVRTLASLISRGRTRRAPLPLPGPTRGV